MKQKEGDDLWSRQVTFAKVDLSEGKSSLVVDSVVEGERSSGQKRSAATARQNRALDALDEVSLSLGEPAPFDIKGVTAVAVDRWRDECSREASWRGLPKPSDGLQTHQRPIGE